MVVGGDKTTKKQDIISSHDDMQKVYNVFSFDMIPFGIEDPRETASPVTRSSYTPHNACCILDDDVTMAHVKARE